MMNVTFQWTHKKSNVENVDDLFARDGHTRSTNETTTHATVTRHLINKHYEHKNLLLYIYVV